MSWALMAQVIDDSGRQLCGAAIFLPPTADALTTLEAQRLQRAMCDIVNSSAVKLLQEVAWRPEGIDA